MSQEKTIAGFTPITRPVAVMLVPSAYMSKAFERLRKVVTVAVGGEAVEGVAAAVGLLAPGMAVLGVQLEPQWGQRRPWVSLH